MDLELMAKDIMTSPVLSFHTEEPIEQAISTLVQRKIGGAPVVDEQNKVIGSLENDDLILRDSNIHIPTAISLLGGVVEWPPSVKHFEDDLRKAFGSKVGEVMNKDVTTCAPSSSLDQIVNLLHHNKLRRLPVVDKEGKLVGIITRGDLLKAMISSN